MRDFIIFVTCVLVTIGCLGAIGATQLDYDYELRGYVDATRDYPLPYRVPRLGVNAELMQYDTETLHQHLRWMEEAHVRWVRQLARWDDIERERGTFDWEAWDRIVEAIQTYNLELVVVLINSPDWARPPERTKSSAPINLDDFANFARAFAMRYGDSVHYYQIWDEPNLRDAWGDTPPNPTGYMALLQRGYDAIKGADENATILMAGLAPTTETRGDNISDIRYLEALYALGAHRYWDVVVGKPYGFDDNPLRRDIDEGLLNFSRIIALREVMVAHGEAHKPLWASHWGWNSLPDDWQGEASIWGQVGHDERLFYTLDGLTRATREWAWMGAMFLEHWQPDAPADSALWGFTIIDALNQPTALWDALVSYDFDGVASNGLYHPINNFAQYSGVWTLGHLGADIGWLESSDSQLTFDFHGRDVSLLLREGDYFAFLYPQVNDQPANATPQDNRGNSYIFLRSASTTPEINLVPVSRDLLEGEHRLTLLADKGWDQWALAGFAVSDGNLRDVYERQMVLGWVALVLSVVATAYTATRVEWRRISPSPFIRLGNLWHYLLSGVTSLALMVSLVLAFGDGTPHFFRREVSQYGIAIILSGGLLALTLPALVVIASSLVLFTLIYNRLQLGIHLVLLYAPLILFPLELYQFAFPMAEYLLLLTVMAGFLRVLAHWGRLRQTTPTSAQTSWLVYGQQLLWLDWLMLAWVLAGLLALNWSTYRAVAVTEWRTLFLEPVLFYGLVRYVVRDVKSFKDAIMFLVLGTIIASVVSLGQVLMGQGIITAEEGARRLGGVYGSPNNLALYVSRGLVFALAYVISGHLKSMRWLAGAITILLGVTVLMTQSVGAILLGMPLSALLMVGMVYGRRGLGLMMALVGLVGAVALWLTQVSARFANLLNLSEGTTFLRLRVWESASAILRDHPLTGLGLDQFLYAYRSRYVRPDAIWDVDLAHPHNILLDHWMRMGVIGLVLFILIQWHLWRGLAFLWRQASADTRWLVLGLMGCFAGILGHGLVDNALFYPDLMLIMALLLGIIGNWQASLSNFVDANRGG